MYLLLLFCLVALSRGIEVPEEKYGVYFDSSIYVVGDESSKYVDTSKVNVERYNDSIALMHGDIIFPKGLGSKLIVEIELHKEASGNAFEAMFSHTICDFCQELGDEESNYKNYFKKIEIPKECPIEAGNYSIKNFAVETDDMEINSKHIGRYEAKIKMYEQTGDTCQDRKILYTLGMLLSIE